MLTFCDTRAIKNGSKQLGFDVRRKILFGSWEKQRRRWRRGWGGDEAAGSFAASAGEMGHCAALVRNSSDPLGLPLEGELIKTLWPVDGCTEEAGRTAAAFFCVFSRPINHVLLHNLRADVDCLGYCE